MPPQICPNCGADVPRNARACPECGADEQTGWSEEASTSGLDLPDESFDYEDFVKKEFAPRGSLPRGVPWFWWVVGVVLIGILLVWCMRR
jgi:hypothetical protein